MRPKGTPEELERIRMKAVEAVDAGYKQVDVARIMNIHPDTLSKWVARYRADPESLRPKKHPGRTPRLTKEQLKELVEQLKKGAVFHGWNTEIWTCPRVAEIIRKVFGVSFHTDHVFRIVTQKLNWSFQRPEKVARERDEKRVQQWLTEELPAIKKN